MIAQCRPLIEVLADIPDFRKSRGKRHPLPAILALACAATLCGYRTYSAMAEGGRNYGQELAKALGFTHDKTPCAATLHAVFRGLEPRVVEAQLSAWAEGILTATPAPADEPEALSIDGKTLRGSRKQGAVDTHLLSVLSHRLGLTVVQQAVTDKTNEIPVARDVLRGLVLAPKVLYQAGNAPSLQPQQQRQQEPIGDKELKRPAISRSGLLVSGWGFHPQLNRGAVTAFDHGSPPTAHIFISAMRPPKNISPHS